MDAGAIELKMTLLTGAVGGVLLVLAELVMMHKKVSRYRNHLRDLHRKGRKARLTAELTGILLVLLVQPVAISMLTVKALGNFIPSFEQHAAQQLENGGSVENRPLRGGSGE